VLASACAFCVIRFCGLQLYEHVLTYDKIIYCDHFTMQARLMRTLAATLLIPLSHFTQAQQHDEARKAGNAVLDTLVRAWSTDRIQTCLSYCRDWNTSGKTSAIAQVYKHILWSCIRSLL
jgi:Utp13 specific WD40 associated domain